VLSQEFGHSWSYSPKYIAAFLPMEPRLRLAPAKFGLFPTFSGLRLFRLGIDPVHRSICTPWMVVVTFLVPH